MTDSQMNTNLQFAAVNHFIQRNELKAAATHLETILAAVPKHPDALYLLGSIHYTMGRHEQALALVTRAVEVRPQAVNYLRSLGKVHVALSQFEGAERCFRRILEHHPNDVESLLELGKIAEGRGSEKEAEAYLRRAVECGPTHAGAIYQLGTWLYHRGRYMEAIDELERAARLRPDSAPIHNALGLAYRRTSARELARVSFATACRLDPTMAEAFNNMGLLLKDAGKYAEALKCLQRAASLKPGYAEAPYNAGSVLHQMGQVNAAAAAYRIAIGFKPDLAIAYNNLGTCLQHQGRYAEALACFEEAARIDPLDEFACYSMARIYRLGRQLDKSIACAETILSRNPNSPETLVLYYEQQRDICAFEKVPELAVRVSDFSAKALEKGRIPVETPFLNITRSDDIVENMAIAKAWSAGIEESIAGRNFVPARRSKPAGDKITLGYLSDGFRDHPATYLISDIFWRHDRSRFKVQVYSYGGSDRNPGRVKIEKECDRFVDLTDRDDFEIAHAIHKDGCDILVDLKGYLLGARLKISAYRPAPVQVRYLGMPGTTGSSFFDYLITDPIVTPPEFAPFFTEKFAYMPGCYQINSRPPAGLAQTVSREEAGLPPGGFLFCSFCMSYKIDWPVFKTWANILARVPDSILWLLGDLNKFVENIRSAAKTCGISGKRIIFAERIPHAEHLARLRCADLALDTVVVSGAATTSDAFWAGVPVLTMLGRHFASRMTASILQSVGLQCLVARNLKEYEDTAVRLASNPHELKAIKDKLAPPVLEKSLFNAERSVQDLEALYVKMWETHAAGKPPAMIHIDQKHRHQL